MRNRVVFVAMLVALLGLAVAGPLAPPAAAQDVPPPKLFYTLRSATVDGEPRFLPTDPTTHETLPIIVPRVPSIVNLTVTTEVGVFHTFSIRSTDANAQAPLLINIDLPPDPPEKSFTVEFTMWAADRIEVNGRNETAEVRGGGVYFFCAPHEAAGMVGSIVVGGVREVAEPPEMGVFLRAYWIGLLGMAGTFLLIGVSYFVIKGSSRHYRDHREHVRRGGP